MATKQVHKSTGKTARQAAVKKPATRKAVVKKGAAEPAVARTVAATKTAAGKAPEHKAAIKKVAAKQPRVKTPTAQKAATKPAAVTQAAQVSRGITPKQALANTRKLLEAKHAHDRGPQPWQAFDPQPGQVPQPGFQSDEARDKAEELHAGESRMEAIQGAISTQDRHNQGKRDQR